MKTEIDVTQKQATDQVIATLVAQESRAVIEDDESLSKGADLAKIIRSQIKKADEDRKENYTGPLNAVIKRINGEFKQMVAPLVKADASLKGKMDLYVREKDRREREERTRLAREAEERALKEAEVFEKAGMHDEAAAAIEVGAKAPDLAAQRRSAPVRGDYGATASARREYTFELEDISEVPTAYLILNETKVRSAIREKVAALRTQAKEADLKGKEVDVFVEKEMEKFKIAGLRVYQKVSSAVR